MQTVVFLAGMLAGGLLVRWAMLGGLWRSAQRNEHEQQHHAVARTAHAHLRANGTLHPAQLARVLDVDIPIATAHLERMTREGVLARHARGDVSFYTLR
ncbi:MAG: hypothetical protein IT405_00985 [Candidatus Yanofskybacteria bacterium]|nr:hypothetical protein [Candidatus Yanofskybacteria bacterium]